MRNKLLYTARRQKGWSQQQLADFAEISVSTVERAERGEPVRVDSIQRLCFCLEKTPEQLGLLQLEGKEINGREVNKVVLDNMGGLLNTSLPELVHAIPPSICGLMIYWASMHVELQHVRICTLVANHNKSKPYCLFIANRWHY